MRPFPSDRYRAITVFLIGGGAPLSRDAVRRYYKRELGFVNLSAFLDAATDEQLTEVERMMKL